MKTEEIYTAQTPIQPSADTEFVKVDIVDSAEPTDKPSQELNGAKMNC